MVLNFSRTYNIKINLNLREHAALLSKHACKLNIKARSLIQTYGRFSRELSFSYIFIRIILSTYKCVSRCSQCHLHQTTQIFDQKNVVFTNVNFLKHQSSLISPPYLYIPVIILAKEFLAHTKESKQFRRMRI